MRRWLLLAALSPLLTACVATTGKQLLADSRTALQEAPVCCSTLATARRLPLPSRPEPFEVVVDKTVQAFMFDGAKAFFVLYELPAFEKPYSVLVTSLAAGSENDIAVLVPRVATYDAAFKRLRYFDDKTLRNRGNNLERTVFINPGDRAERYLAIFGSDLSASLERAYSVMTVTPVMAGPVMFNMYSGRDGKSTLHSAPGGKLQIEVQGLAPPAAR